MMRPVTIRGALLVAMLGVAALTGPSLAFAAPGDAYDAAARRLIEMGRDNMRKEAYGEALEMFESALVADPASVEALVAIGDTYGAIERGGRSLRYYRQALEMEPNNRGALAAEALALIGAGDRAGAKENLDRLRRICGDTGCHEIMQIEQALAQADAEAEQSAHTAQSEPPDGGAR